MSGCETIVSSIETARDSVTSETLEASAQIGYFGNTDIKCTFVVATSFLSCIYCLTDQDITDFKNYAPSFFPSDDDDLFRFHIVSDVVSDMETSFNYYKDNAVAGQGSTGFTDEQINNATIASAGDLDSSYEMFIFESLFESYAQAETTCATSFLERYTNVRSYFVRRVGNTLSSYGVTPEDTAAVTAPVIADSLYCGYGSSFVASDEVGQCPDSYPTW